MTLEEFLVWEERQELRYEFDGFVPMAMTGGSAALTMPEIGIEIPLAELYEGVTFEDAGEASPA